MERKRWLSLILAMVLLVSILPIRAMASSTVTLAYTPYAKVQYDYSTDVSVGTIRFIQQMQDRAYYDSRYWPSSLFGKYEGSHRECGTSCISMALSYIGVNKTPNEILTKFEGSTRFNYNWDSQYSSPTVTDGMNKYINGNGTYSPVIIRLEDVHHYILLVGRIAENRYLVVDPATVNIGEVTINGMSATYNSKTSTISQIWQYYNASAQIEKQHPGKPVVVAAVINSNTVKFTWNGTENTTHYGLVIYDNSSGVWKEWKRFDNIRDFEDGYYVIIQVGEWKVQLIAYNSSYSTLSDEVFFTVTECPHSFTTAVKQPTCTSTGSETYTCSKCGYSYTDILPVKHSYITENIPGTCTEYGKICYTCTLCGDKTIKEVTGTYSEWTTTKPVGIDDSLIQTKTQYRYADYATKTSEEQSLSGWNQISSTWKQSKTGTVQYVRSWPVGFKTDHSLYATYDNSPKTASETATNKTTVTDATVAGYLYYHWCCGGTYAAPGNRSAKDTAQGNCVVFHAFFSTDDPSTKVGAGSDASVSFAKADCCKDSVWFYPIPVYSQSYTTYYKEFTYGQWGAWSAWSDVAYTGSETRKVESRILYRYCTDVSPWSEIYPGNVADDLIQTKTQYRYSDQATTTSRNPVMAGGALIDSDWVWNESGTVEYVKSWPVGFKTDHSLYATYNNSPKTASETATNKTTVTDATVAGYLYYHWCCGGTYAAPGNRSAKDTAQGNCVVFHAFFSTDDPSTKVGAGSDASVSFAKADCCMDSVWFYPIPVYTQTYTHYDKEFTYSYWTDWSEWRDTVCTASNTRKVETRTLYRYAINALGEHSWNDGTVTKEATCTAAGEKTFACTKCSDSYTEVIPALGHRYMGEITTQPGCQNEGLKTFCCELCGDSYTVAIPSTDHSYKAETVAPTCTEQGCTIYTCSTCGNSYADDYVTATGHSFGSWKLEKTATCTEDGVVARTCGTCQEREEILTEAIGHSFETGKCTACGTPDPDYVVNVIKPTLTLKFPTLEFKDIITVNAMFTAENIDHVVEMGMITYSKKVDVWNVETAEHVIPGTSYDANTGCYIAHSQGIHAKYLGDSVYIAVYAELADGTYVYSSKLAPYSPVQYATNQLKNSTDTKLKQLCAAMLNYGAEAQLFFGHNTNALANASLTAAQKALPAAYNVSMTGSVPAASATKQGSFADNKGFAKRYPSISFESAFCINYFFTPNYIPVDGITLYYWNEADYNAKAVLTTSNATGKIKLDGSGTGEYRGDITGIAAKNLSDAVYVAAAYRDSSGTVWTSGVLGYSIGTYCSSQVSKGGTVAELAKTTAVYGYHAEQYFG